MKKLGFAILLLFCSGAFAQPVQTEDAKNKNICKEMKGKILIYMVFVDTKNNNPWTEFDINTAFQNTSDVSQWLTSNAKTAGNPMEVEIKYFQSGKMKTAKQDLPYKSIRSTTNLPGGYYLLNSWADKVAFKVGTKIKFPGEIDNSIIRHPKNNVELISKIRDIYRVENVVLIYLLNNTYTNDVSIAVNTGSEKKIEYIVASSKDQGSLANTILQIFGAADFTFVNKAKVSADQVNFIEKNPKEIMVAPSQKITENQISPLTQYLIGWTPNIDGDLRKVLEKK